jgi:hypothetical protein
MNSWVVGLVLAVVVVTVASEVSPEATNWVLFLVIVGIVLSRWSTVRTVFGPILALTARAR